MAYDLSNAKETMAVYEIEGIVRVEIGYLGEGVNGDFNPDDPSDVPLLRLDAVDLTEKRRDDQDASFCTLIPVLTQADVLGSVCRYVAKDLAGREEWKRRLEELSWLDGESALEIHNTGELA